MRGELFKGDHVAITRWKLTDGMHYQVTALDNNALRQGKGYLLLSLAGLDELVRGINMTVPEVSGG